MPPPPAPNKYMLQERDLDILVEFFKHKDVNLRQEDYDSIGAALRISGRTVRNKLSFLRQRFTSIAGGTPVTPSSLESGSHEGGNGAPVQSMLDPPAVTASLTVAPPRSADPATLGPATSKKRKASTHIDSFGNGSGHEERAARKKASNVAKQAMKEEADGKHHHHQRDRVKEDEDEELELEDEYTTDSADDGRDEDYVEEPKRNISRLSLGK